VWTQQGSKLVGTGATGHAFQGNSVAMSGDGNTAIVGGPADGLIGAAWVYTRSGGVWTQQGSKLVGTGGLVGTGLIANVQEGQSVAISGDGNTTIIGGYNDNSGVGAIRRRVDPARQQTGRHGRDWGSTAARWLVGDIWRREHGHHRRVG
jgi:hypothetical protein